MLKQMISATTLLSGLAIAGSVNATMIDLDLTKPTSTEGQWWNYSSKNTYSNFGDDLELQVTGWSNQSKGFGFHSRRHSKISSAKLGNWSVGSTEYGLGVERGHSPNHAIDNSQGDYDMLLLNFSKAVTLSGVSAGWRGTKYSGYQNVITENNGDLSVLAYQGDSLEANLGLTGKDWQDLLKDNWTSAGDHQFGSDNKAEVNSGGLVSQYWLVGAYNENLSDAYSDYSVNDDFFKVSGVSVDVAPVPLPGSMLLFGASLLGIGAYRRRKTA